MTLKNISGARAVGNGFSQFASKLKERHLAWHIFSGRQLNYERAAISDFKCDLAIPPGLQPRCGLMDRQTGSRSLSEY